MNERSTQTRLETAAVTDRGLSEKRPHNEDSYLLDTERRLFAIADGVGGAHAGEVASRTAVEVLEEAFRHHKSGEDAEDLMEIAIQRANASIYQMSREQKEFAMMATTIVALHLDGRRATIGHVGDSRLYRLDASGRLHRETEDHSVVEEEVRAGRMTAEQAANHPSRNVISRALGAEVSVEVDLKTIEVEDGTVFLLCSDGITRHLTDAELSALLAAEESLEAACAEMKRRCYERGAEDNLTAVAVRLGARVGHPREAAAEDNGDEATLASARAARAATATAAHSKATHPRRPTDDAMNDNPAPKRSRIAGELADPPAPKVEGTEKTHAVAAPEERRRRSPVGRASRWLATLLLLLIVGAGAFYGGLKYQQQRGGNFDPLAAGNANVPTPAPTPLDSYARYVRLREQVDSAPSLEASRMAGENQGRPLESPDPEFLTLYGRALLLSGKNAEAVEALKLAVQRIDSAATPVRDAVRVDARLGLAAAALRTNDPAAMRDAAQSLDGVIVGAPPVGPTQGLPSQPLQTPSPFR